SAASIPAPSVEVELLAATPSAGRAAWRPPCPGGVLRVELQKGVEAVIEEDIPRDRPQGEALPADLPDACRDEGCRYQPAKAEALTAGPSEPAVGLLDHQNERFHARTRGLPSGRPCHHIQDLTERLLEGLGVLAHQQHRAGAMIHLDVLDRRV